MDFMELNPVTARLLEMIESNTDKSGRELLLDLAREIEYPNADALVTHGLEAMQAMRQAEIIIGSKSKGGE